MPQTAIDKLDRNFAPLEVADGLSWYDIRALGVEGRGWDDTESFYDRLPARAKGVVREPVWELSHHSAGMSVRFVTDAPQISARWKLRGATLAMSHMPASGVSGLDLYAKVKGASGGWTWAGVGIPSAVENTAVLATGLEPKPREYLLYLPLYNGVESVAIGVPESATLKIAKPRSGKRKSGVVVYGTSIVQGGCACRAGMGYPEIMGRALDCAMINLGFSGNGPMEVELAHLIAELNPAVYVLDCLPNMQPDMVPQRFEPFLTALREKRPRTPIVYVENITYQRAALQTDDFARHGAKNKLLKEEFKRAIKRGVMGLHYVSGDKLLHDPRDPAGNIGTVDGTHPTDVGFLRMAAVIGKTVSKLL